MIRTNLSRLANQLSEWAELYERISEPVKGKEGIFVFKGSEGFWRSTKDGRHVFFKVGEDGKPSGNVVVKSEMAKEFGLDNAVGSGDWLELDSDELMAHPKFAKEIFSLVDTAYKSIGGNLKIKSVDDLKDEAPRVKAIDLDNDKNPDGVVIFKPTFGGMAWKVTAIGHDGEKESKSAVIAELGATLKKKGYFMEVSSPISDILISKYGPPAFDEEETRKVLVGKQIEWLGKHPEGKYPEHNGWYYRVIGGKSL